MVLVAYLQKHQEEVCGGVAEGQDHRLASAVHRCIIRDVSQGENDARPTYSGTGAAIRAWGIPVTIGSMFGSSQYV